jgi:hypothetical protein
MRKSQKAMEAASFQKEEKVRSFLREAMTNSLRRPLQVKLVVPCRKGILLFALNVIK